MALKLKCPYCGEKIELAVTSDGMYLFKCKKHLYLTAVTLKGLEKRLNELTEIEKNLSKERKKKLYHVK